MKRTKIEKAEKEVQEAEEAVLDALSSSEGESKEFLKEAAKNIEETKEDIIESQN
jgi:hypothetical protein